MDEFWQRVNKGTDDECWEWLGSRTSYGYGNLYDGSKTTLAHRHAWEITNGPVPDGMFICHTCDNPSCQNPKHLFVGTPADNMIDMTTKGRGKPYHPKGVNNGRSKLTPDDVREIRRLYATGDVSQDIVAKMFEVAQSTIHDIVWRKKWAHIKE